MTKKSTTPRKYRKTARNKPAETKSQEGPSIVVGLMMIALIVLVLIALSDHGVRLQSPVYVAQATQTSEEPAASTDAQSNVQPSAASCNLDKIGTWSEVSSAGPQRIEVGGHGVQQLDFYPLKGVKSISYIVPVIAPNEVPAIYYGYGSIWEGQFPVCANFDFVADATNYAKARLDSGHSGLVIDLRGGQFKVVANTANMSQKDIDALLAQHMAAMDPTK